MNAPFPTPMSRNMVEVRLAHRVATSRLAASRTTGREFPSPAHFLGKVAGGEPPEYRATLRS